MSQALQYVDPINPINKHVCVHCSQTFTQKWTLARHLREKICIEPTLTKKELIQFKLECELRDKIKKKMNDKDLKNIMKASTQDLKKLIKESTQDLVKEIKDHLIKQMGGNPSVTNQNLHIVCVGSNDNLLDILTASEGLPQTLEYVKGCALAHLVCNYRILERVYKLGNQRPVIKFFDYDEQQRKTIENNIVGILHRSYLKCMENFQTDVSIS